VVVKAIWLEKRRTVSHEKAQNKSSRQVISCVAPIGALEIIWLDRLPFVDPFVAILLRLPQVSFPSAHAVRRQLIVRHEMRHHRS